MSAIILGQCKNILKYPIHQICIMDDILCNRQTLSVREHMLTVPIYKNESYELVSIPVKLKIDWDSGKTQIVQFDKAIEKCIGRIINRHENTRYIKFESHTASFPIIIYYLTREKNKKTLTSMDCYARSLEGKELLEKFTKFYFDKMNIMGKYEKRTKNLETHIQKQKIEQ